MSTQRRYAFGDYVLDLRRGALLRSGADVRLRPKSFAVLRILVERHGELVTKQDLLDGVWGRTVVTEGSVTQCLIEVRRAIGDEAQQVLRTVPRRGYIFDARVTSLPDEPVDAAPVLPAVTVGLASSPQVRRGWGSRRGWTWIAVASILALVLGTAALRSREAGNERPASAAGQSRSIAVLPFVDMSAGRDQQYLADGIAEEILDRLARAGRLRVIARTSSFALRDRALDAREIARRLGVDYVLEGSVRRSGDRVRVTAQLIDARTASHAWSDTYERPFLDLFGVQDEIATKVTVALQATLTPDDETGSRPASAEAYERSLEGRHFIRRRGPGDIELAIRDFEQAVAIDPQYGAAWADLAGAYGLMAWASGQFEVWRPRQRDAALRAVEAAPRLWTARVRLAQYYFDTGERDRALDNFRLAASLKPDDTWLARFARGFPACTIDDPEPEIEQQRLEETSDPLAAVLHKNLGLTLFAGGHLDPALAEFRKAIELSPGLGWDASIEIGRVLLSQGHYEDAYAEALRLPPGEARDSLLALLHDAPGHEDESEAALRRLAATPGDFMHGLRLAEAYARRGGADDAFAWLQRARDQLPQDDGLLARTCDLQREMSLSPFLRPLRFDPRWAALTAPVQ